MVNPEMAVGGWFVYQRDRTRHCRLEITGIRAGENYTKNRWSIGGIITTTLFSLRSEYLAGKDGGVKSDGFMPPDATGCYAISTLWLRMTISMQTKPSVGNRPII